MNDLAKMIHTTHQLILGLVVGLSAFALSQTDPAQIEKKETAVAALRRLDPTELRAQAERFSRRTYYAEWQALEANLRDAGFEVQDLTSATIRTTYWPTLPTPTESRLFGARLDGQQIPQSPRTIREWINILGGTDSVFVVDPGTIKFSPSDMAGQRSYLFLDWPVDLRPIAAASNIQLTGALRRENSPALIPVTATAHRVSGLQRSWLLSKGLDTAAIKELASLPDEDIETVFNNLQDQAAHASQGVSLFGSNIPRTIAAYGGPAFIIGTLLLLLSQLKELRRHIQVAPTASTQPALANWTGFHANQYARALTGVSLYVLPTVALLLLGWKLGIPFFGSVVALLLTAPIAISIRREIDGIKELAGITNEELALLLGPFRFIGNLYSSFDAPILPLTAAFFALGLFGLPLILPPPQLYCSTALAYVPCSFAKDTPSLHESTCIENTTIAVSISKLSLAPDPSFAKVLPRTETSASGRVCEGLSTATPWILRTLDDYSGVKCIGGHRRFRNLISNESEENVDGCCPSPGLYSCECLDEPCVACPSNELLGAETCRQKIRRVRPDLADRVPKD